MTDLEPKNTKELIESLTPTQLDITLKFLEAVNGGMDVDEAARLSGIIA